jgi:hypothetical protein
MNKGNRDIFVIKLNSNGEILWKKTLGGSGYESGLYLTTTSDGSILIISGTSSNDGDFKGMNKGIWDIFVIKLSSTGEVLWKKTFGGSREDLGLSLTTTSDDGMVLTGHTQSNDGDFEGMGKGNWDIFVIKLSSNGEILWKKTLGGSGYEEGLSLTTTSDDGMVLAGHTQSNDGAFEGMGKGDWDIFVVKLNSNGEVLWKKTFGGVREDLGLSLTTTSDGRMVLAGYTQSNDGDFEGMGKGNWDIFVTKLNSNGEVLWKKTFGGVREDLGLSLTTTSDGGMVLTGYTQSNDGDFEGMGKGDWDIFVVKLNSNGEVIWKKTFGGIGFESGRSITTTSDDGILITGGTSSNDGDFNRMNKGGYDIFIMKLDTDGYYTPSTSIDEQTSTSTPLLVTPNPLSTSSTITYTLDTSSLVRIELMNTLGQVVDVVFAGYRESGTHGLPLNVSSLTSGMYSVRMTSDFGVHTTQVCVVR